MSSVLWKGDEDIEPPWRLVMAGRYEFDGRRCIDEQTGRLLTEDINVRRGWPIFRNITVAPISGYFG